MNQKIDHTINGKIKIHNLLLFVIFFLMPLLSQASSTPIKTPTTIQAFINDIWRFSPQIQAARSQVAGADANFSQSRRPIYNPSLNLDVEHTRVEPIENTYTAEISQTLDLFHQRRALARVGRYGFVQAKANLVAQKLNLAIKTLKTLAEYQMSQAILKLAKRRTRLVHRFKQHVRRQMKSGDVNQNTLNQASLAYAEAIAEQAEDAVALTKAKQQLMSITQVPPKYWPRLPHHLPKPLQASVAEQQIWLQHLPIMQVYNAQVATAVAGVQVARTQTKPAPTVAFRGGTEDRELLLGANLSIPLYVLNNFKDQLHAANDQAIAIAQIRINAYQQAKVALQGDLSRYQILRAALVSWHHAAKGSLNGGITQLDRLWSSGEINTTNYLTQLEQRIDIRIIGTKLKAQSWQVWFSLMKTSGQLHHWLAKT